MNKHLQQLIAISNLDKEIDSLEPQIEQKRSELDKAIRSKEAKQAESLDLEEDKKDIKLQIARNEQVLADVSAKLENIYKKISEVRSERELKALNVEEEIAKEQSMQANQEIQRLETALQHKTELQSSIKTAIAELESTISGLEEKVSKDIEVIKDQQHKIFAKKQKLIITMDQKLISFYEKVRKWAKNASVVPVRKQACGGCFIRINDRVYAEIIQSNDIITCPHCGRILYIEEAVKAV
ncbi:zinc ribbon domain-containing protein [Helicobacter sp. 11S02596-1]|uniref:zinc ribbon domain-containing protein n=1 Tax=Helicobacter sp. 11S02596-1 TaxID=1476194 RepID=UPI000BA6C862|nr:zinc ribbon domain-containing protein [Helicobacter sp. 11S02596-1]PAF45236.1 hypothetical protein BJI48_01370 [Helicobacter sp. 11S02596-1]